MCQIRPIKIQNGQCSCGCHGGFSRNVLSRQEQIDRLEDYKGQLELELRAVKEHLETLKVK